MAPSEVTGVDISPDDRQLVSAGPDGFIRRWDTRTGAAVGQPIAGGPGKPGGAFVKGGQWIASATEDGTLRIWDVATGSVIHEVKGQGGELMALDVSTDGSRYATGSKDGTVRLWDVVTGNAIGAPIHADDGWVTAVTFSPDGSRLLTGGADGVMRLWNVDTQQPTGPPLPAHRGPVIDADFSRDGQRIGSESYVVGNDQPPGTQLRITDSVSGKPIVDGPVETGYEGYDLALTTHGHQVAIGGSDGKIYQYDADTGAPIGAPLTGHAGPVEMVAYSGDGSIIVSAGDRTIHVWQAGPAPGLTTRLPGFTGAAALPAAVSPDGRVVATRDENNQSNIALWQIDTGVKTRIISTGYHGPVTALAWQPGGHAIAFGRDNSVRLWDARSGPIA